MKREYYSSGKLLIGILLFGFGSLSFGYLMGAKIGNTFMIVFSLMILIIGEGFVLEASSYKQRGDD